MADYSITFARSARKELEALDHSLIRRIFPKIEVLSQNPHPKGSKKLHGQAGLWRIRIGEYRVIYQIDDRKKHLDVTSIRHRKDVYR